MKRKVVGRMVPKAKQKTGEKEDRQAKMQIVFFLKID